MNDTDPKSDTDDGVTEPTDLEIAADSTIAGALANLHVAGMLGTEAAEFLVVAVARGQLVLGDDERLRFPS